MLSVLRISRELLEVVENVDNPKWVLEAWHGVIFLVFNKSNRVPPVATWNVSLHLGVSQVQCSRAITEKCN